MIEHMSEQTSLGGYIREFMRIHNLKEPGTKTALDVSLNWIRSALKGENVNTHRPFAPGDAMLRHVAAKMNEYSSERGNTWRITFEELKAARDGVAPAPGDPDDTIPGREAPGLRVLDGLKVSYPPDPVTEEPILREAQDLGLGFPTLSEPGFWDDPPEERRGTFLLIQQAIEDTKRFYRMQEKKGKRPRGPREGSPA